MSAALLIVYLPGCSSRHVGTPTPQQFIQREHPESVRVTRNDGSTITLYSPLIRSDSIIGSTVGGLARPDSTDLVGFPLADVRQVEVRRTSTTATLLVLGLGLLAVVAIVACGATDKNAIFDPC